MTAVLEVQGRERTAFCRPVRSFSKVARQVGMKDEDGPRLVPGSWQSPRRAPRGPRTAANTARSDPFTDHHTHLGIPTPSITPPYTPMITKAAKSSIIDC